VEFRRDLNLFLTTLNDLKYGFIYISDSALGPISISISRDRVPATPHSKYSNRRGLEADTEDFPTDRGQFPQEDHSRITGSMRERHSNLSSTISLKWLGS